MNLNAIIAILIVVAIILVAVVMMLAIARAQEKSFCKLFMIRLANQGNARSHYELWADDPAHVLRFDFSLNGIMLGQMGGGPQSVGQATPARPTAAPNVAVAKARKPPEPPVGSPRSSVACWTPWGICCLGRPAAVCYHWACACARARTVCNVSAGWGNAPKDWAGGLVILRALQKVLWPLAMEIPLGWSNQTRKLMMLTQRRVIHRRRMWSPAIRSRWRWQCVLRCV